MSSSDLFRLQHILDAAKRMIVITRGKSRNDMEHDLSLPYALLGLFQIIGEAARHISEEYRSEHPEIDWSGMKGLRNRLTHAYFDVDYDILYQIIQNDIPPLISTIEDLLDQLKLDL